MKTAHILLDTYLRTSYKPDAEYVDGELAERDVVEYDHNMIQQMILIWFHKHGREWGVRSILNQRTRVSPTRVRIPDVSIFPRETPIEQVFTRPQLIAIEVLSPEDRHSRVAEKVRDYIQFGIPDIWIIDAKTREGWDCSSGDWVRRERLAVAGTPIYLSLPDLFAQVDRENA